MRLSRSVSSGSIVRIQRIVGCVLLYALLGVETAAAAAIPVPSPRGEATGVPLNPQGLLEEALIYFIQQKMGNVLPLQLDPSLALPTVPNAQLPGGPFRGQPLEMTAENVTRSLPPGDYEIPVMAYCTQYSVHRPGRGSAAVLAPLTGTQSQVLGNLLWRGTQAGKSPAQLQTTAWAIQAGVPYSRLSKQSQADIDAFAPEARTSLEQGFSIDAPIRQLYNDIVANPRKYIIEYKHAKGIKFPPDIAIPNIKLVAPSFDQIIAQLGPAGRAYVQAEADQRAIVQQLSDQQHGQESLLLHQAPTDPPMPPTQGPWTVRVPNVAYMRFVVNGGNMQANNVMQIRVLPKNGSYDDAQLHHPQMVYAAYQVPMPAPITVTGLMGGSAALASQMMKRPTSSTGSQPSGVAAGSSLTAYLIAYSMIASQALIVVPSMISGSGKEETLSATQSETAVQRKGKPCKLVDGTTVPIGTIAYRFDVLPDNVVQHGIAGSHLNLYKANQNPKNGQCFWQPNGTVPPPPKSDWIDIKPFDNSGN
jgi:hypothetical protein